MSFKKIITAVVTALVILISPFTFQSVKAEDFSVDEHFAVLSSGYATVLEFYREGGVISDSNCYNLYTATGEAVKSAEALKLNVTQKEYNSSYRDMHTDVFRVFKNTTIYRLENSYDENLYSPTLNGTVAINNKLSEAKNSVSSATSYQTVVDAELSFYEYIGSDEPSLKTSVMITDGSQPITVKLQSESPIFAEDDVITTNFFIDTVIIKNVKVALINNPELLDETNGVACFFSVRWIRNDVTLDVSDVSVAPTTFAVKVTDLGVELNEESCLQLVRYLGRGEVEFIDGVSLSDGYIVFTLSEDIESDYELDFAVVAKGYAIKYSTYLEQYVYEWGLDGLFVSIAESVKIDVNFVIGAFALLIVPIVLSILYFIYRLIVRGIKRKERKKYKEYKKEYGAFKKYKKRVKEEEKLNKKQKRLLKKQKRLERRLRRKSKYAEEN